MTKLFKDYFSKAYLTTFGVEIEIDNNEYFCYLPKESDTKIRSWNDKYFESIRLYNYILDYDLDKKGILKNILDTLSSIEEEEFSNDCADIKIISICNVINDIYSLAKDICEINNHTHEMVIFSTTKLIAMPILLSYVPMDENFEDNVYSIFESLENIDSIKKSISDTLPLMDIERQNKIIKHCIINMFILVEKSNMSDNIKALTQIVSITLR